MTRELERGPSGCMLSSLGCNSGSSPRAFLKTYRVRRFFITLCFCRDDDDINDVATMGGVNLSEETKNILATAGEASGQLRSCRDDVFFAHTPLAQKIRQIGMFYATDMTSYVGSFCA